MALFFGSITILLYTDLAFPFVMCVFALILERTSINMSDASIAAIEQQHSNISIVSQTSESPSMNTVD